jgi:hypothetical protein
VNDVRGAEKSIELAVVDVERRPVARAVSYEELI